MEVLELFSSFFFIFFICSLRNKSRSRDLFRKVMEFFQILITHYRNKPVSTVVKMTSSGSFLNRKGLSEWIFFLEKKTFFWKTLKLGKCGFSFF